jgi:hypothetical protein
LLYQAINIGLFDRFKSDKAPTQKGLTVKEWCDKGVALTVLRRPRKEVIQCFEKALAIDPMNAAAQYLKSMSSASK